MFLINHKLEFYEYLTKTLNKLLFYNLGGNCKSRIFPVSKFLRKKSLLTNSREFGIAT